MRIFDYITNRGSLYSETGVLGIITGGLLHSKCTKGWYLQCTASKYITFTLPSLAQKSIITVTKVNNNYVVTQTNTTATITSLVLNNANYLRYIIYDSIISATSDLKNIQAWINTLQPLTYQKRLLQLPKPTELKQSGLVAAYNKIRSGVYNDLSVSGKHGTVTNCLSTTKGIKLHGVSNKIVLGNIGNVKSISFRIKLKTTTQPILEKAANSGLIHVSSGVLTSLDFANKYINGVAGTAITASQWHNVILTSSTNVAFSAATLGLNNATYGNFEIEDLRFYSVTLTTQEIKAYHNSFNEVILHEQWKDCAVGSSILPSGWIKNGGSFVCGESTTNDAVIKSIRKGTKYLRCVTSSIVAMPIKMERGCTIEFTYYAVGLNIINMFFLYPKSLGVGYSFVINNGGRLGFYRNNGVANILIGETEVNFISANINYRYRIISTSTQFFIYILGGVYSNWTPITGSPFTNTEYTRGNYFNINSSVVDGNRVTDILIQSQIKA